ncbi:hypothetical protein ESZ36_08560 [Colwellia demingiae]|uniref:Uncharacterized protein n=1 Tax=Colwellia demingiae TaxID=89401 RepID=A0A5C6QHE9_9GAMM|nr:hypothetical protein [Colwellia demingiae]TWX68536.1 hypothetical protein ESZ36_08560 [Colwellia demingiae]
MAITAKATWLLPTNTENLQMVLAQGLITDASGFLGSYYKDVLNECPGYISLFKSEVPGSALKLSKSEDDGLISCIIKINLKDITLGDCIHTRCDIDDSFNSENVSPKESNNVPIPSLQGKKTDELDYESILIQAPLPLTCIEEVIFSCKADLDEFKDSSSNVGNVSTKILKCKVDKKAFQNTTAGSHLFHDSFSNLGHNPIEYNKAYSFGGLASLSFYFSKNGEESANLFNSISKFTEDESQSLEYKWIYEYFFSNEKSKLEKWNAILEILNDYKKRSDIEYKNKIIEFLNSTADTQPIAEFLTDYHRSKIEKSDTQIIDEYIEQYKKEPKVFKIRFFLFMLFYKDSIEKLIKYTHVGFREEDYVLLGMLFGMNNSFIGLPKWLVEYENLHIYISTLMANYAHKQANTGLHFKEPPKPLLLTEMLSPKKLGFIAWFGKNFDANNCFKTVMPNKVFQCDKGKSTYEGIVVPECQIVNIPFFKTMSSVVLDDKDYSRICKEYKGK